MDIQIIIALCEGPHDVAFLNKIFKTQGFVSNENSKLGDYPKPISDLLIKEAVKSNVEGLNIQEVRRNLLPANTLVKDGVHILFYVMGGDGKAERRKEFLKKILSIIIQPGEIRQGRVSHDIVLGMIYFFDADTQGVMKRLASVKREIGEIITTITEDDFVYNGHFGFYEGIKLGAYIFSDQDNNIGKLEEDILLPIMKVDNDDIFKWADKFLDYFHDENRLFPLKLQITNETIAENRSRSNKDRYKYDRSKSIIGAIGQLQQSGGSNTVCIGFTDYLTLDKIQNDR